MDEYLQKLKHLSKDGNYKAVSVEMYKQHRNIHDSNLHSFP